MYGDATQSTDEPEQGSENAAVAVLDALQPSSAGGVEADRGDIQGSSTGLA